MDGGCHAQVPAVEMPTRCDLLLRVKSLTWPTGDAVPEEEASAADARERQSDGVDGRSAEGAEAEKRGEALGTYEKETARRERWLLLFFDGYGRLATLRLVLRLQ